MARWDVRPFTSPLGGTTEAYSFPIADDTTSAGEDSAWLAGNWCVLNADGYLDPFVDGTADPGPGTKFISLTDSAGIIQMNNLGDPVVAGTQALAPCLPTSTGQEFITANIFSGDDTLISPDTGVDIGDTADIWVSDAVATLVGHVHGIDIAGNFFTITRKLDALGRDADISGQAATHVVFRQLAQLVA